MESDDDTNYFIDLEGNKIILTLPSTPPQRSMPPRKRRRYSTVCSSPLTTKQRRPAKTRLPKPLPSSYDMDAVLTTAVQLMDGCCGSKTEVAESNEMELQNVTGCTDPGQRLSMESSGMELQDATDREDQPTIKALISKQPRKRAPNLTYAQVETIRTYFERGMVNSLPESLDDRMTVTRLTGLSLQRVDVGTPTTYTSRYQCLFTLCRRRSGT
jgi:uncharacterized ParB-like nuclease family protein